MRHLSRLSSPGRGVRRWTPLWPLGIMAGISVAAAGAWTTALLASPAHVLVVNESPSLPRGLYRLSTAPIERGSIVALIPPPVAKAYLEGLGAPADARLLKRVVAIEGDLVCKREAGLEVRSVTLAVARRDRQGQPLPSWRECRRLTPDEFLVLGDSSHSFDSRYFGPVRRSDATGPYVEAIHW